MKHRLQGKFSLALSLAVMLALLLAPLALADNIQNDVEGPGDRTITEGGSTTVGYRIQANSGDGEPGCNASDGSPATVNINVPSDVTADPGSLTFTACGEYKFVDFTSSTPGSYEITVTVSDSGTGTYNTNPAKFTLIVEAAPPSDTTPPVITPNASGTLGNNGWYVSDVTVTWTVVDDESEITSTDGCDATTIDYDTAGVTLTCEATSAGGTASESVTIKRDATAPEFGACPAGGPFLLNSGLQPVGPISADASISGLDAAASTLSGSVDTSSVGTKTVDFTAVDNAGNSASQACDYSVIFDWSGFFRPVDNLPAWNSVKAGSAVPVKFSLAGDQGLDIFAAGYPSSRPIACDAATTLEIEETVTAGGSSLSYDPVEDQYVYVWKTDKKWSGTCRQLVVKLIDGTAHEANFKFK